MKTERKAPSPASTPSPLLGRVWVILLAAVLLLAPWIGGQLAGPGPAVGRALAAAAGVAWIIDRWGRWTLPRPAAWLWAFFAWSIVTVIRSQNLHASLMNLSDLVSYALVATLAADAAASPRRRMFLAGAVLLGLLAVGVQGAYQSWINEPGWRVFGPFTTPNLFATYLVTLLPLAAFVLLARREGKTDPDSTVLVALGAFAVLAGGAALLSTGSKGGVLGLAAGTVLAYILGRGWRWTDRTRAIVLVTLAAGALLFGARTFFGRVGTATTTEAHSGQFRVMTWKGAARMAAANPVLGTGAGTFGASFNRYAVAGWTAAAHNHYLQTAAETGVPGLLLFLAALGSAALALWRRSRAAETGFAVLAVAALAGLLAAAAHNVVDYGWTLWAPSAALWALVGLGVGEDRAIRLKTPWAAVMLVIAAMTLAGGFLVGNAAATAATAEALTAERPPAEIAAMYRSARGFDPLDGRLAFNEGKALLAADDTAGAITALREAVTLSPTDGTAWRRLGETYLALDRKEEARDAFEKGLSQVPNSPRLLLDAARLAEAGGKKQVALDLYRRLIAVHEGPVGQVPATPELVDPEPLEAYHAVALEDISNGRPAEARRHLEALIKLADRYLTNREKFDLIWRATGRINPDEAARVRWLKEDAEKRLAALEIPTNG